MKDNISEYLNTEEDYLIFKNIDNKIVSQDLISMTKFLLIGPSGAGKSITLKKLLSDNSIEIYDLDCLLKESLGVDSLSDYFKKFGNENFFNKSKEIIENLKGDKNILIAVGAGSIDFLGGHQWYKDQNTIVLIGNPDIIYSRSNRQRFHPTIDIYKLREFSIYRQNLYNNSKYIIDVTYLNPDEIAGKMLILIKNHC